MQQPTKVLFVCLGNICRSPIAEEVFRQKVAQKALDTFIQCDSAGTAGYHIGNLPDARMRQLAQQKGFTLTHRARQFSADDFHRFDYIMAMDEHNYQDIIQLGKEHGLQALAEKVFLYRPFDPAHDESKVVPDPYYEKGMDAFEDVYQIVDRAADQFLQFLEERHSYKS